MDKRLKTLSSSCLSPSEGPLPAQCWAPEPTGEDRRQLFTAAVPRRGPHLERPTQPPAFQTDGGQLLSELLEAKPLPGTYRGWWWWWRWWLNPQALWILPIDSFRTRCHLMHYLGLEYMAQEHRSRDHTYPVTPLDISRDWCLILNFATELFFIVYLKEIWFVKYSLEGANEKTVDEVVQRFKTCSTWRLHDIKKFSRLYGHPTGLKWH